MRTPDGLSLCQVWKFKFQPFWFYYADKQTDRQTESHTDVYDCITHTITVDVSNNNIVTCKAHKVSTAVTLNHRRWQCAGNLAEREWTLVCSSMPNFTLTSATCHPCGVKNRKISHRVKTIPAERHNVQSAVLPIIMKTFLRQEQEAF